MNLISQHCLGGYLYNLHIKERYGNPFIWSVIDYTSMFNLITHFDSIDWFNIQLVHDNNMMFSIIIDDIINVKYVHYRFDKQATELCGNRDTKIGGDIRWNRIWEYIYQKYIERLQVMLRANCKPLFCICNFNTVFNDAIYTNEQLDVLESYPNVFIHRGCAHLNPLAAAETFYATFGSKFK